MTNNKAPVKKRNFLIFLFMVLPKGFISRVLGYLTRVPLPGFFLDFVIDKFCGIFSIDKNEILYPAEGFKTFDQFFTRGLKKGVHKVDSGKKAVVSPVDARVDQFGKISRDSIMQAKGIEYSLRDLIPSASAGEFTDGSFITLYLSPADYHRIHSPVGGEITGYFNIPGRLFTVQEFMVNGLKGLFTKNERLISYIRNERGTAAVCKIGAMNVGRISLNYADAVTNSTFRKRREIFFPENARPAVEKGAEIGAFHLGSTIVLLFSRDMIKFADIKTGDKVRVGQRIGVYI